MPSLLPEHRDTSGEGYDRAAGRDHRRGVQNWISYARRAFRPGQMDWEYACRQMVYLCTDPKKVYELSQYRNEARNQWARDDPAFLCLLFFFMVISSLSYGVAFQLESFEEFTVLIFFEFLKLFLFGSFMATVTSTIANSRMRGVGNYTQGEKVEWLHSFDIHTNSYFLSWLQLSVLQYVLLPFLLQPGFFPALVANVLYVTGLSTYVFHTHIGYRSIPFLENTNLFIHPIGIFLVSCFMCVPKFILIHWNLDYSRDFHLATLASNTRGDKNFFS